MNKNSKQGEETRARIMAHLRKNQILICADSYLEIAEAVGVASTSNIFHHLQILEKQGLIKRPAGLARHIEIIPPESKTK
jgi:SOS-response transcriptional repressor LexA